MKSNSKVSIIVPVYNVVNYLEECLDSLIGQTYPNIEIICVNDGSTDGSARILGKYACYSSRVHIISQKNRGLSEARNAGLRVATGDYVMFIDSDDYVEPDIVQKGILAFEQYDDLDCVCFGMKAFPDTADVDFGKVKELNNWLSNKWYGLCSFDVETAYKTNANVCNKMYRLSDIKGKIEFIPNMLYEDIYFSWIMFLHTRRMFYAKGTQYHYRVRKGSIMTDTNATKDYEKAMHHLYNWDKIIRDISYDRELFLSTMHIMKRLLKKYAWWVAYYSPEDMSIEIEKQHRDRIAWLDEISYTYNSIKED